MPITPPNPIVANVDYRYDELYQSMMLVMAQRQIDATEAISGDSFNNKLLQVDTVGNTHYIGYANAGSATSGTVWAIKKVVEVGNDVTITWADGTKDFNNIWNDRLTLTYS
jgi:hypothetical protein